MKKKKRPEKIIQITYGIGGPYGLSNYGNMYEWQWKEMKWKIMSKGLKLTL